jgi:hypothetical protein
MTITIKIPCKTADNAHYVNIVMQHLAGITYHIDIDAGTSAAPKDKFVEQQVPKKLPSKKAGGNKKKLQKLGGLKRNVFLAHAKKPQMFCGLAELIDDTDLTREQVQSVITDGVSRKELERESAAKGAKTRITARGLERLKHDTEASGVSLAA